MKKVLKNRYCVLFIIIIVILCAMYYLFFPQFEVNVLGNNVYFSRFQKSQSVAIPNGMGELHLTTSKVSTLTSGESGTTFTVYTNNTVEFSVKGKQYRIIFKPFSLLDQAYQFINSDFLVKSICIGSHNALVLVGVNANGILTLYHYNNMKINQIVLSNAPKNIQNCTSAFVNGKIYIAYSSDSENKIYVAKVERNRLQTIFSQNCEYVNSVSLAPIKNGIALSYCDTANGFKNVVYQIYPKKVKTIGSSSMGNPSFTALYGNENLLFQAGISENNGYGVLVEQYLRDSWFSFGNALQTQASNINFAPYENGIALLFSSNASSYIYSFNKGEVKQLGEVGKNENINRNSLVFSNNLLMYFYFDATTQEIVEKVYDGISWEKNILFTSNFANKYGTILAISNGKQVGYFVLFTEGTYKYIKLIIIKED